MEAMGAVNERLRNVENRVDANHSSITTLRNDNARQDVELAIVSNELEDVRGDVSEIKQTVERDAKERRQEGASTRKALYTAAVTMGGFSLTILGLIATLLRHA